MDDTQWQRWLRDRERLDVVNTFCLAHMNAALTHPTFGRLESRWPGVFDQYYATFDDWHVSRLYTAAFGGRPSLFS